MSTHSARTGGHLAINSVRLRARGVTARVFAERTFHPSQRTIDSLGPRASRPLESTFDPRAIASGPAPRFWTGPDPQLVDEETATIEMRVARGRGLVRFILG